MKNRETGPGDRLKTGEQGLLLLLNVMAKLYMQEETRYARKDRINMSPRKENGHVHDFEDYTEIKLTRLTAKITCCRCKHHKS